MSPSKEQLAKLTPVQISNYRRHEADIRQAARKLVSARSEAQQKKHLAEIEHLKQEFAKTKRMYGL